jgi:hypothetical protein
MTNLCRRHNVPRIVGGINILVAKRVNDEHPKRHKGFGCHVASTQENGGLFAIVDITLTVSPMIAI